MWRTQYTGYSESERSKRGLKIHDTSQNLIKLKLWAFQWPEEKGLQICGQRFWQLPCPQWEPKHLLRAWNSWNPAQLSQTLKPRLFLVVFGVHLRLHIGHRNKWIKLRSESNPKIPVQKTSLNDGCYGFIPWHKLTIIQNVVLHRYHGLLMFQKPPVIPVFYILGGHPVKMLLFLTDHSFPWMVSPYYAKAIVLHPKFCVYSIV